VSQDQIPILWSDFLKETLGNDIESIEQRPIDAKIVKLANIKVYEAISAEYAKAGVHADERTFP
jgi:hypothetical protein